MKTAVVIAIMLELSPDNVCDYLRRTGRIAADCEWTAEALAWGVSNVVLRVSPVGGDDFVLKQSRTKLRTESDWFSRLDRIHRETDAMRVASQVLPGGAVPRILFEDRDNYLFAMEAVSRDHVVWKQELLEGRADSGVAATAGRFLGLMHRETSGDSDLASRWRDSTVFDELRIDPFYRTIAARRPEIAEHIDALIRTMESMRTCLVHADFSPKNILLTEAADVRNVALVDFETAHYGDPAFDLGFFLSHILLKGVHHAPAHPAMLELARTFLREYDSTGLAVAVEQHAALHLAACMLSRVDGKSPVDYLDENSREFVRRYTIEILTGTAADNLAAAINELEIQLGTTTC